MVEPSLNLKEKSSLEKLRRAGIKNTVMLTGDRESVAKAVCNVRASAPLGADWSDEINADYQKRGKKNKK